MGKREKLLINETVSSAHQLTEALNGGSESTSSQEFPTGVPNCVSHGSQEEWPSEYTFIMV